MSMILQDWPSKKHWNSGGGVDVVDLAALDLAHVLVVTDGQGQHGAHHAAAIDDVARAGSGRRSCTPRSLRVDEVH